jgi:5-methylcytosine-specific restriction endonuclease McrA
MHLRQEQPRLRLDAERYQSLRDEARKRDGWRCQNSGDSENLQVHHLKFRSQLGSDLSENLITFCAECEKLHRAASSRDPFHEAHLSVETLHIKSAVRPG